MSDSPYAQTFERVAFRDGVPDASEYERCTFRNCDFSNARWAEIDFVDCRFEGCNLSMVVPNHCGLKQVAFVDCKIVGVDFAKCASFAFAVSFERCNLDFALFTKAPLSKTVFAECSIREASFREADLTRARFVDCDLTGAAFDRTKLEHADMRGARGFSIDPEKNRIAKAKFARDGLAGLLGKYGIVVD